MISRVFELGGDQITFMFMYIYICKYIYHNCNLGKEMTALLVICSIKGVCFKDKVLTLNRFT